MEILRRTDLGKMHADLPMGDQTMKLVCNVALAGLKKLERDPRRSASPRFSTRRFFFFFFFFFFEEICRRPVGACKLSSAPKGRNASLSSSQTL